MSLQFYNTLSKTKEEFKPINENSVGIYSCGPTVYDYAHIGNLRSYVFADILCRTLRYLNYNVNQVINITDIGHLSSDADSGEDKMTKGLLREGKELTLENMRKLAEFYAEKFKEDAQKLNIELPKMYFASDYIKEDIELIKRLEAGDFTYQTSDGVYFNTAKMPDYGAFWGGKRTHDENEARIAKNSEKINPEDFALWKFNKEIGFPSPWGNGFPGWHIECSAMSIKFLGEQFDIHTGGIDHISIHHTNERAQSECATGKKPFVNFWLHNEFVDISGMKMAKSDGNFLKLNDLIEKNINPLAYRFWLLMANYHTKMNFNLDALLASETALKRLYASYLELGDELGTIDENYINKFKSYIEDDLDTPRVISLLWDLIKEESISKENKKTTILEFDKVLAIGFSELKKDAIPEEIEILAKEREEARQNKDYKKSDDLRDKIISLGYEIKDTDSGYKLTKI